MALDSGHDGDNTTLPSGSMAKAIYDSLNAEFGSLSGSDDDNRKRACAAIAKGVVDHIRNNADVIIKSTVGGLQTSTGSGNPTDPPSTKQTISSALD
jgi:hypothetical protein